MQTRRVKQKSQTVDLKLSGIFLLVPGAGVEPAQGVNLLVFETSASTDSAIRADFVKIDCKCNHIFPFGKKSG